MKAGLPDSPVLDQIEAFDIDRFVSTGFEGNPRFRTDPPQPQHPVESHRCGARLIGRIKQDEIMHCLGRTQ